MCQHSLPSFITPMKNQAKATIVLGLALLACFIIYILVCYTATFSYGPNELEVSKGKGSAGSWWGRGVKRRFISKDIIQPRSLI